MRLGPVFSVLCLSLLSGCYTQLSTLDNFQESPASDTLMVMDSTGDSVKVVRRIDTVESNVREVCVWERDLTGYPRLRCYNSYYPRNWLFYNNSPWWYRNDPFWYDYQQCPRYYYFDSDCGCCRYYTGRGSRYHLPGRHYSPDSDFQSGAPNRSRAVGVPNGTITETKPGSLKKSETESSSGRGTETTVQKPRRARNPQGSSYNDIPQGVPKEKAVEPDNGSSSRATSGDNDIPSKEISPPDKQTDTSGDDSKTRRKRNARSW